MSTLESSLRRHGVSEADLGKARHYQQRHGGALERILLNIGALDEATLPGVYSEALDAERFDPATLDGWAPPAPLPEWTAFLSEHGWYPFSKTETQWLFVTRDPLNWSVTQWLSQAGLAYRLQVASPAEFEQLLLRSEAQEPLAEEGALLTEVEEDRLRELASEAPTVNLLNSLISRALRQNASDLHLEPVNGRYRARFRIDGVLHDIEALPSRLQLAVVSRLKILAGMDIAEKRRPQDGKIETRIANIDLDIRVSALPLALGESMVLRFLRKDTVTYEIDALGLEPDTQASLLEDLRRTAGVILLTGPTGSGKTTTLYTFLNALNSPERKIITLEDPVEYQLPGLNQVQVRPELGFDFSAGLRSVVRQDPDVIMVGEIRDRETCQIGMQAALTGHLVFSTVHTNDAPSAFTRLLDLGVEEFLLNAGLISIVAQRLVRKLCDHCKREASAGEVARALGPAEGPRGGQFFEAEGCDQCGHTGYRGRLAITEYFRCDEAIQRLPKDENFLRRAREHMQAQGIRNLQEDGLVKASRGLTTIEEVLRVAG